MRPDSLPEALSLDVLLWKTMANIFWGILLHCFISWCTKMKNVFFFFYPNLIHIPDQRRNWLLCSIPVILMALLCCNVLGGGKKSPTLTVLSFSHADTINLFPLVARDGQACDYRPTSKPRRYYIPIPPLIESMTRCQPLISETTNSVGRCGGGLSHFSSWLTIHL